MDQKKIGQFIQTLRKAKGLTQKTLAEMLGVSDKTVSKWESGNGMPDISLILQLCTILEINVNELLSGERLLSDTYSEKAETNMLSLLRENKIYKKKGFHNMIAGLIFITFALLYIVVSNYGISISSWYPLMYYLDTTSLLALLLLVCSCVLLCRSREWNVISTVKHFILPVGVLMALFDMVGILFNPEPMDFLSAKIACSILPVFYALVIYLIVSVIDARKRKAEK